MEEFGRRKRMVLFAAAFLLPATVLCALLLRMASQDRELEWKRSQEERRRLVAVMQAGLVARLDQIRARLETNSSEYLASPIKTMADPELAFVTLASEGSWLLPWDATAAVVGKQLRNGPAAEMIANAERLEFQEPGAAAILFRRGVTAANTRAQSSYARLGLARSLFRAGAAVESQAEFRALLLEEPSVTDEHGIPFALYAANHLHERPPSVSCGTRACVDLLQTDLVANAQPVPTQTRSTLDWMQAVDGLHAGLSSHPPANVWVAAGKPLWLISSLVPKGQQPQIVVGVRPERLLPPPAHLSTLEGDVLGPPFTNVHLILPANSAQTAGLGPPQRFLYAALSLLIATSLFSGWLLWRDVRREVAVSRIRSQFVTGVSHELKTPLTSIRMFAETLRLRPDASPARRHECLDTLIHESERLSRLVDNVLDFSRIEQGRRIYQMCPISLHEVVSAASRTIRYEVDRSGFHLELHLPETGKSRRILADADALQQAVINLLTNAIKYAGESRRIALDLSEEGSEAVIRVIDQGVGIPEEHQRRIFDQFFRVDSPENQRIAGAGLGLTVVADVARAHGGRIDVQSSPGHGSTFSLRIPIREAS